MQQKRHCSRSKRPLAPRQVSGSTAPPTFHGSRRDTASPGRPRSRAPHGPGSCKTCLAANPFVWLVERLRDALLDGRLALHWGDAVALGVALALFLGGRWVFRRLSPHFEDFL
jgi:hypothetical protein